MTGHHHAEAFALATADHLAHPDHASSSVTRNAWWRQSLAHGAPGIALLHIELAATGLRPWQRVHDWLSAATTGGITSGGDSHPFYGAPAIAHALACAADHLPGAYTRALAALDDQITADVARRLTAAHQRLETGTPPLLAEFDALQGLTGYGIHLLHRSPDSPALRAILDYLVGLTDPLTLNGSTVPGWWTLTGPSGKPDDRFGGGHANHGAAHGISGVLSLLAAASLSGIRLGGHHGAITRILDWFDHWEPSAPSEATWPYWITRDELQEGVRAQRGPVRPSWCYGTVGLARAQQLAALAIADRPRQERAENALISALNDPAQLAATSDLGLCHGFAGLAHVASRLADNAPPTHRNQLRDTATKLLHRVCPNGKPVSDLVTELLDHPDVGPGLLDGAAGTALAVLAPAGRQPPRTAWDSCLVLSAPTMLTEADR